jgi:hypothetical protein
MEWGAAIFWSWFLTRQLQDPTSTLLNSHNLIFEKLIFPTMSKTTKFGKKTQGILGVKWAYGFILEVLLGPIRVEVMGRNPHPWKILEKMGSILHPFFFHLPRSICKDGKRSTSIMSPPVLTPKIPCVFWTKLFSFWHGWKNQFLKKIQYENLRK